MPSGKAAEATAHSLGRLYGDQVAVDYYTAADPAVQELMAAADEAGWPLPLALLNEEILFAGGVQPLKLVAAVARYLEQRNVYPIKTGPSAPAD